MNFNIKDYEKELLFIPLGGTTKIGLNMYVYHYKGKLLIVDFGCGFANDSLPGIDITVPDISFLTKHKKDIVGIVLTHAHEDHVGAIQYFWHDLECPIYATPFATTLLRAKFLENNFALPAKMITVNLEKPVFNLGPFEVEMVPMCHTVPEMHSILIRTEVGNIFHTGDWKLDSDPIIGKPTDEVALKKYGKEGILAVVGDSTNVFNSNHSGSEGELKKSLLKLIKPCKKMVIVTAFSSNVARFEGLMDIAKICKRKVVLSGRNLRRIFNAGLKSGYLKNSADIELIEERDVGKHDKSRLMVIATGCQGEPFASLTKIANQTHQSIKITPGDTVIFSSKIIPGNDAKIYRTFDKLVMLKANILMEQTDFTHVSGHSSQGELKKLYDLLKPKLVVPVHGEQIHLYNHVRFARSLGIDNSILISDGDVIKLDSKGTAVQIAKVETQELAVYGNYLYTYSSSVMKMRRKMRDDGMCIVILFLSDKYHLKTEPILMFPGFLEEEHEKHFIDYVKEEITMLINEGMDTRRGKVEIGARELERKVKTRVKQLLTHEVQKVPVIHVEARIV